MNIKWVKALQHIAIAAVTAGMCDIALGEMGLPSDAAAGAARARATAQVSLPVGTEVSAASTSASQAASSTVSATTLAPQALD